MKLLCSLLQLLLYLAVTGRSSDAQLLQQDDDVFHDDVFHDDDVFLHHSRTDELGLQLAVGTTSIDAAWVEVPGASYYTITWTPGDNGGTDTVYGGSNIYTYTIIGLVSCTVYNVTVQARSNEGDVGLPETRSTTTLASDPDQVTTITVNKVLNQSSQLAVSWSKAEGAGNCAITYRITWTPASGGVGGTTSDLSYTITGLAACTTYHVCVAATTDKVNYTKDKCSNGTTDEDNPDQVSTITVEKVLNQSSQLAVSWPQAEGAGKCAITYRITWTPESGGESIQNTTSDLSYTITGLAACTTYSVCVAAKTDGGYYTNETCSSGTTDEDTPGPPWGTMIEFHDSRSLLVSWSPPQEPRGIITNYNIMWSPADIYNGSEATVAARVTQYIITNLQQCTTYTVTVTAATSKGYGEHSYVNGTTESEPPPSPSVTCEEVVSPHQATVTWPPVITTCTVTGYSVNYTGDVLWSDDTRHDSLQLLTTHADLSDLTPWTTYTVCVAGVVVNNIVGAWSCCYSTTLEAAPGMPVNLSVVSVSSKTLTVSWALPEELNGVLTGYYLDWGRDDTNLTAYTTLYTITDLHPKSEYDVTLMASTAAGWGPRAVVQGTTYEGVNVGAVVGGVVGGFLLLALLLAAVFFRHNIKDKFKAVKLKHQTRDLSVAPPTETAHHIKKDVLHQDIHHPGISTRRVLETGQSHQKAHSSQPFFKATAKKDISYPRTCKNMPRPRLHHGNATNPVILSSDSEVTCAIEKPLLPTSRTTASAYLLNLSADEDEDQRIDHTIVVSSSENESLPPPLLSHPQPLSPHPVHLTPLFLHPLPPYHLYLHQYCLKF